MIVIKNDFIPFGSYASINLFGIVFTKRELSERAKNHEAIHSVQIVEMAVVTALILLVVLFSTGGQMWWLLTSPAAFYIWYGVEYVAIRLFHKKQNDAYHDVSLEEEAYNNDDDLFYLDKRKHFTWVKHLKPKSYGKS